MKVRRSIITVEINCDPVPGWGHEPADHVKMLQDTLDNMIPHYKPTVKLVDFKIVDK